MSTTASDPLALLEGYLAQDPHNDGLRAEAFETALRSARTERAEAHLAAGLREGRDPAGWRLRQAHWLMARHDWAEAQAVLQALLAEAGSPLGLQHAVRCDLGLIALRIGQPEQGLEWLRPCLADEKEVPDAAVQVLCLRLKHHAEALDEMVADARRWDAAGALDAQAAGVASLGALDAEDLAACDAWSHQALAAHSRQLEALVSQGSLALARQSANDAKAWLERALQVHPADGRAWSAMAFAEMLAGELHAARAAFERALAAMPDHIGTWHGLGWTALFLHDLAGAQAAFQHALELDRNFGESHGGMAVVLARTGQRAAAEEAVEIALRLDRHGMAAHYARAVLDGQADDSAQLQRLAARLLKARRSSRAQ
jgi:tetratricopeptide (TPR) repeat protein